MGKFKLTIDILIVDYELDASVGDIDIFFLGVSIAAQAVMDIDSDVGAHELDHGILLDAAYCQSVLSRVLDLYTCVKGTKFCSSFERSEAGRFVRAKADLNARIVDVDISELCADVTDAGEIVAASKDA